MFGEEKAGFYPVSDAKARVLVLGSFPSIRSLEAGQYYAHPQNAFWKIMGSLFGAGQELPYLQRLDILKRSCVALWDVLANCVRPGSMDGAIVEEASRPNDFITFFAGKNIERVCFNGRKSEHMYKRLVLPGLPEIFATIEIVTLPSTSPAYASMRFEEKLEKWRRGARGEETMADGGKTRRQQSAGSGQKRLVILSPPPAEDGVPRAKRRVRISGFRKP